MAWTVDRAFEDFHNAIKLRVVERARIVLCAAEGLTAAAIASRVGCGEKTAKKWRGRYARAGIEGLRDAARPGAPLTHGPEVRALLIATACTRSARDARGGASGALDL